MLTKEQIVKVQRTVEKSVEDERVPFALRALSDIGRFKIFKLLAARKEDMCVTDIANIFNISVPAASQQLHVLEITGIVKKERMGQMICYKLKREDSLVRSLMHLFDNH